jgi:hypothetical protein
MPGFLGGSGGSSGVSGEIRFPAELIDPVTKLRVSEPQTLIDTDFEYGLQPTKWETVELINNTPSFFSASGDTTISNLVDMITTAGSREVKVTTSLPHGLAVGIPLNISGTKSLTADGSYIINSVPDTTTFTYLCKQNQLATASIVDLYTSVITGQFFQGSQIKISDSEGLVTDAQGQSTLTLKTDSPHGFGVNTPFYFLNLNSTISQEFDASNTGAKTFDASNTATAQSFDGSNTLTSIPIDLQNKATSGGFVSTIATFNATDDTITVTHTNENFVGQRVGTPLYYNVSAASGYFASNPRGILYLKRLDSATTSNSTFQVSLTPNGPALDLTVTLTGTFQLANNAVIFSGTNTDVLSSTQIALSAGTTITFDGANTLGKTSTVNSYSGTSVLMTNNAGSSDALNLYVGSMLFYSTTGTAASGLTNNTTYFVTNVIVLAPSAPGLVQIQLAAAPGGSSISVSGGSGTQTLRQIGVSLDRDIIHVPAHGYEVGDMIRYEYPVGGRWSTSEAAKDYYFVEKVLDAFNVQLGLTKGAARDGSSAERAVQNIAALRAQGITTNGMYWFDPALDGQAFQSYVKFNFIDGSDWHLILKVHNRADMTSGSAFWTNSTLRNETDANLTSGNWSKYAAWNRIPFTRLMMEMTPNRVPPIMIFNTARTMFQAINLNSPGAGFAGTPADASDPQISTSASTRFDQLPMKSGSNFPVVHNTEFLVQQWGINMWGNNAAQNNPSYDGLSTIARAGAWVGCVVDEGGHVFNQASNGGADSGYGFGGGAGNPPKTWSAGYGEWAGGAPTDTLPGYLWVR